jgi:hypothetical protein
LSNLFLEALNLKKLSVLKSKFVDVVFFSRKLSGKINVVESFERS